MLIPAAGIHSTAVLAILLIPVPLVLVPRRLAASRHAFLLAGLVVFRAMFFAAVLCVVYVTSVRSVTLSW